MSHRSPTIKRILKEASELTASPSPDFHAAPLESNLFEWHFTLRGPPAPSPFSAGLYHGRIVLPPSYPLRPPSFRFLTPSGRFEANREICLSISGFHEETWQPAWGIRTALVAIRSFMDADAAGAVGGMAADEGVRRRLAAQSGGWKCGTCAVTNGEIMAEQEAACEGLEESEEKVPEDLRLGYREDIEKKQVEEAAAEQAPKEHTPETIPQDSPVVRIPQAVPETMPVRRVNAQPAVATRPTPGPTQPAMQRRNDTAMIDKLILAVACALIFMVLRIYLF